MAPVDERDVRQQGAPSIGRRISNRLANDRSRTLLVSIGFVLQLALTVPRTYVPLMPFPRGLS
jgi:hypothetical protein